MIHLSDPDSATITATVIKIIEGVRNRAELARILGINRAQIYKWLDGKEPSLPELSGLAHATGTSIRIDLGPLTEEEPKTTDDRIAMLEQQVAFVMQTAVANQEAILRLLRSPPSPP